MQIKINRRLKLYALAALFAAALLAFGCGSDNSSDTFSYLTEQKEILETIEIFKDGVRRKNLSYTLSRVDSSLIYNLNSGYIVFKNRLDNFFKKAEVNSFHLTEPGFDKLDEDKTEYTCRLELKYTVGEVSQKLTEQVSMVCEKTCGKWAISSFCKQTPPSGAISKFPPQI